MSIANKSLWLLVAVAVASATAQQTDPVPGLLAPLTSPDVASRVTGFYTLLTFAPASPGNGLNDAPALGVAGLLAAYPNDAPEVVAALNQLLVTENTDSSLTSLATGPNDESPGDFYADVIEAVVTAKDASSIPALAGAIATGGMATTALAGFGKASLPAVLPLTYSTDIQTRDGAAFTLMTMLSPQFFSLINDPVSKSQIRAGLQRVISVYTLSSTYKSWAAPYQRALASLPSVPVGDLNGDGVVNCADLAIVKTSFGKKVGQPGFDIRADINGDGVVNVLDLSAEARLLPAGTTCN